MFKHPEKLPESPESRGTKEERSLLKRLLNFRKRRHSLEELSPEAREEFLDVRRKIGKPHVPSPPSKN